jgi:hypothetical protein
MVTTARYLNLSMDDSMIGLFETGIMKKVRNGQGTDIENNPLYYLV